MANITVTTDVQSVVLAAEQLVQSFRKATEGVKQLALQSAKYGANGELLKATFTGIDSSGRAFTATAKLMGDRLVIMSTQFSDVAKQTKNAKSEMDGFSKTINGLSNQFQRFAVNKALNAMTDGLKEGFNAAKEFQIQVSQIRTISQDAQINFNGWAQGLKQTSDQLGFSLQDTTKAAYDAISNQVTKGAETFAFLKDAGDLARVNMGATLEQGVNLLSSAINAYNLSASSAVELSALFFATIDEGRVTMKDMADTLGRVAILAKGLDIPINELAASIAFLTQKGVTTDDAFTFMRNVFVQLQKPSEQLSAFFRSIGVESGKAAIQTYGFMGILQKIKDQVNSGDLEVAKLFPEIRAQQPIQAALNDFAGFERLITKFRDTGKLIQDYQKAIEIRAESPADYINKEFNKIQNTFTVDLGQKLLEFTKEILVGFATLNKIFGGDGSLQSGLKTAIVLVRDLTIGVIAFRTASALAAASIAATGAAAAAATPRVVALSAAMKANLIGLAASGVAILASRQVLGTDIGSNNNGYQNTLEQLKNIKERASELQATQLGIVYSFLFGKNQNFAETSRQNFQVILQGLAQFSIQTNEALTKAKQNTKNATEDFKNAFQTYTDNLKEIGKKLSENIQQSENLIKDSQKNIEGYRQSLEDMINDIRNANAVGQSKIDFLNDLQSETKDRAIQLFQSNAPEDIKEAEKLFAKVREIEREKFLYNQQYFKEQRQKFEEQNPDVAKFDDVAYKNKAIEDSNELQRTANQLNAEYKALQDEVIKRKREEIALDQKKLEQQNRAKRDLEDNFKAYNEFSAFSDGGVDPKYKNQLSGRVNIKSATEDFDRISNKLRESVAATGDVAGRIQLENTIAERRKQLLAELYAAEKVEVVKLTQDRVAAAKKETEERSKLNKADLEKNIKEQKTILEQDIINPDDIKRTIAEAATYNEFTGGIVKGLSTDPTNAGRDFRMQTRGRQFTAEQAAEKYRASIEKAKTDQEMIGPGQFRLKSANLLELQQSVVELKQTLKSLYIPLEGENYLEAALPGASGGQKFKDLFNLLDQQVGDLIAKQGNVGSALAGKDALETDFNKKIKPLMDQLKSISPETFEKIEAANNRAATATATTADAMLQLKEAIDVLKNTIQTIPNQVKPEGFREPIFGLPGPSGLVPPGEEKAYGGWIGRPSSVIGPDKYHTVLGDGEHVTNAESASQYADVLTAINKDRRGINRQNLFGGNMSTTKVGDINIVVNESKDGQETGRQIWSKIQREMRRGNITPRT